MADYETYLSPFTWRYGSPAMRAIWSEAHKRRLWRRIWVALAESQMAYGLVQPEQVADLKVHAGEVDVARSLEVEAEIHHDLMAELQVFATQCKLGGGILHLGATSADIEDNTDAIRLQQALDLLLERLDALLSHFAERLRRWADLPLMAYTHLQPAEPTTLGYRLAAYAQDLFYDWEALRLIRQQVRGKGFKGAVGTGASYTELVGAEQVEPFEARVMAALDLEAFPVSTQVYPRTQDFRVISALAGLAASLHKFAFDLRVLQTPSIGELGEPFGSKQVGSSAMPFKRNPIQAEKVDSLARFLAQLPRIAWDNAALSLLERTLDDSANRRSLLPEAFLACDELLIVTTRLLTRLEVDEAAMARNLATYAPFAATERLLMALSRAGANRQEMHARLREHSLAAWQAVRAGEPNPLVVSICQDPLFQRYFPSQKLREMLDVQGYVGIAARRARQMAETIEARQG